MCEKAVEDGPWHLKNVPDNFKTKGMCEKAVQKDPWRLYNVPDNLKTKEMCEKAVQNNRLCLEYVPEAVVEKLFFWPEIFFKFSRKTYNKRGC